MNAANDNGRKSKPSFQNYLKITEGSGKRVCVRFVPGFQPKENTRYYVEEGMVQGQLAKIYEHVEPIQVVSLTQNGVKKTAPRGRPIKGNLEKIALMVLSGKNLTTKNVSEVLKIKPQSVINLMAKYRERYGKKALTKTQLTIFSLTEKNRERTEKIQKIWLEYNQTRDAVKRDAALKEIG